MRWFVRCGLLDNMTRGACSTGTTATSRSVQIVGRERAEPERLLDYCAGPACACERLEQAKRNGASIALEIPAIVGREARRRHCGRLVATVDTPRPLS